MRKRSKKLPDPIVVANFQDRMAQTKTCPPTDGFKKIVLYDLESKEQ